MAATPKHAVPMHRFQARIPEDDFVRLQEIAGRESASGYVSVNDLVIEAVRWFISERQLAMIAAEGPPPPGVN